MRTWIRLHAGLFAAMALMLSACAAPASSAGLIGRWKRLDLGPLVTIGDPLASLAQDTVEFRDQGLLVDLIVGAGSGRAFTTTTGGYVLLDASHIQINGKCYQGYDSHACSQTYTFKLDGDRLTLQDGPDPTRRVDYQRVGPAAAAVPPTLVPPGPSATP